VSLIFSPSTIMNGFGSRTTAIILTKCSHCRNLNSMLAPSKNGPCSLLHFVTMVTSNVLNNFPVMR
jgi:hypothetical protein